MTKRAVLMATFIFSCAAVFAGKASAQGGGLIIGGGLGAVLDDRRNLPDDVDDLSHKMLFVALKLPMTGIELRGEGLWPDDPSEDKARAFIASAVFSIPLVLVTPYAQIGYGDYNFGDPDRAKWSAGVGARLNLGTLGIFLEATRYNRMETDLITGGLTLNLGGTK